MKAVILAAGVGNRLKPLTNSVPKCLIDIKNGISSLDYQVNTLKSIGFSKFQIAVVVGHKADEIKKKYENLMYINNDKYYFNNIYSFYLIKNIKDDFILLNSDVLFPKILLEQLMEKPSFSKMIVDRSDTLGTEEMKIMIKKGFIKRISKDLPPKESDGEYIGVSFFKWKDAEIIFKEIEELLEKGKNNLWYEDAINNILAKVKIKAHLIKNSPWIEIDTIDDLREAREKIEKISNYAL